jgi:hypothetical protein
MRRIDLARERRIITVEELEFEARLAVWLDRREAEWQSKNLRRGRSPTKQEQQNFDLWRSVAEEQERERFYGITEETE